MANDVPDLVIHQLLIQRGKNRTLAGGAKHDLEVLGAIPHEAAHALITGNAKVIV